VTLRIAALTAALVLAAPSIAAAATNTPAGNRSLSRTTIMDCAADPSGSDCISLALADINAARAAEGVRAMVLPGDFASMSVPVQLLNLANLERVDRGLSPILGLSGPLDRDAQAGAAQDADPMPTHFYGTAATSNWAGGDASTLEADFDWMYDDGMGSGNLDCTSSNQSGCWGHRHDILWSFSGPIAMGAGYATGQYGPSMTELFVGGDTKTAPGQPDAPVTEPSRVAGAGGGPAVGSTASAGASGHSAPTGGVRLRVTSVAPARGAVIVIARCAGVPGRSCKLAATVGAAGGSAATRSAATLTIQAGRTRVIRIALDRAAIRLLARRHTLRVHVAVKPSTASGAPSAYTLTLRSSR
jgi:hypothetical protein